jgi:hypothetical protein
VTLVNITYPLGAELVYHGFVPATERRYPAKGLLTPFYGHRGIITEVTQWAWPDGGTGARSAPMWECPHDHSTEGEAYLCAQERRDAVWPGQ